MTGAEAFNRIRYDALAVSKEQGREWGGVAALSCAGKEIAQRRHESQLAGPAQLLIAT